MFFFFSSRRRHTICALVPGVQTCALPICTITYNPRDGVFTVSIADDLAGVSREVRFQDPAHRTDFAPAIRPVREAPDLAGFNYLAAADGDHGSTSSFFYQRPGTTTKYVTLGGFVHLSFDDKGNITKIGRAHVCTPVTNEHLVCRLPLEKKNTNTD